MNLDFINNPVFAVFLILLLISIRLLLSYNKKIVGKNIAIIAEDGDGDGGMTVTMSPLLDNDLPADVDMMYAGPPVQILSRGNKSMLIDFIDAAAIAIALVSLLIKPFIIEPFFIPSNSMYPTLQENDRVLVTKYDFNFRIPQRGEIVIFHAPKLALQLKSNAGEALKPMEFVKRVIGLPGDHIQIIAKKGLYINGNLMTEPYLSGEATDYDYTFPPSPYEDTSYFTPIEQRAMGQVLKDVQHSEYIVPPGYLFMLGDNRSISLDSHRWGCVPITDVIGRPICIILPKKRIKFIK